MNTKKIFVGGGTGVVIALFLFANISIVSAEVGSVTNLDGTLTISPTTHHVVASLSLGHANTWTGQQTFSTSAPIFSTMTQGSVLFAGASGLLSQDNLNLFYDAINHRLGIGTSSPAASLHIKYGDTFNTPGEFGLFPTIASNTLPLIITPSTSVTNAGWPDNSGVHTLMRFDSLAWSGINQGVGSSIDFSNQSYADAQARIVFYNELAGTNKGGLEIATNTGASNSGSSSVWRHELSIFNGTVWVGAQQFGSPRYTDSLNSRLLVQGATADSTRSAFTVINSTPTNLFTVRNDGNVGIGTTTPGALLDVNSNSIITEQSLTPLNSTSACVTGMESWDASYEYRCVATNTWKRVALSSF